MKLHILLLMIRYSLVLVACLGFRPGFTADRLLNENPGLAEWFESQVSKIEQQDSLLKFNSLDEWEAARPVLRRQLYEMLGLHPLPERTPLHAETTGVAEEAQFSVERVHFQSMPGLYVTGNLYVPKNAAQPLPAVLYVCGHGNVHENGVSYGSKVAYQRHGCWFARNGYVCLVIDTLQLGEIEGIHHGTYRYNRWWWNSRGYSPAGVEAWNCIRALDYLQSRPEVDGSRLGVTGRSGGGAYSWWISALDDRIQCAVPVAGITSLRDHVVNGCVEGHCDCMYMVNAHQWDYATVAALVAPRPLLISNTDKDSIFPLEGVIDIHRQVRHIYNLYKKPDHLGLQITEGPHKDTQELHIHAFRWMNRFLRSDDSMIDTLAVDFFEPRQLKVFDVLPADERNTRIDESFIPESIAPELSQQSLSQQDPSVWFQERVADIQRVSLRAWPNDIQPFTDNDRQCSHPDVQLPAEKTTVSRFTFESQPLVPIVLDLIHTRDSDLKSITAVTLIPGDADLWAAWQIWTKSASDGAPSDAVSSEVMAARSLLNASIVGKIAPGNAVAIVWPRGLGPNAWIGDERKQTQIRRRFQLIGTTVDTMRAWDICAAIRMLQDIPQQTPHITLQSTNTNAALCLVASLFESIQQLDITAIDGDAKGNAPMLNLSRIISLDELIGLALTRCPVRVAGQQTQLPFAHQISSQTSWPGHPLTFADE